MSASSVAAVPGQGPELKPALTGTRLTLLRLAYLPLVLGLAIIQLPLLLQLGPSYELMHGVVICMLSALCLLSVVGLFRPIAMLPVLAFEIVWKVLWLSLVALPAWQTGPLPPDIAGNLFACALVVPIVAMVPWTFAFRQFRLGAAR